MCRLFGLHAGADPVPATFWLLDAPDSLREQSHREPDGAGIGFFDLGAGPVIDKQPIAAWQDDEFAREAKIAVSRTFVAHVRYASTGAHTEPNTHPFTQDGRLFAHNGTFGHLAKLDQLLADLNAADLVVGQTDSERMFALITAYVRRGSDPAEAITAAVSWIADNLPVFSLNLILATPDHLWALRYPATHRLYVLDRTHRPNDPLLVRTDRIAVRTEEPDGSPALVIASEPMDGESGWRLIDSGELLHVDRGLTVTSTMAVPDAPRFPLTLADLSPKAAASQGANAQNTPA